MDSSVPIRATVTISILTVYGLYFLRILYDAYNLRMKAINEYGPIIHEFDPYFNFRATEYLYENGWRKFVTWFDYKVWYPLGRPVGTTIYPGMQITAVAIKNFILRDWSLNDICCYMPAWFGVIATIFTGLLAYECSIGAVDEDGDGFKSILEILPIFRQMYSVLIIPCLRQIIIISKHVFGTDFGFGKGASTIPHHSFTEFSSPAIECGLMTAAIMSVIPAHTMRSVGGAYDNESIAMTAMTMTFYLWTRSLRNNNSPSSATVWGCLAGLAHFYMAAVWGGYVFVINMVGIHAGALVLFGRYSTKLYRAYTAFYAIGTFFATQVPVVGLTPIKSLEQLGPLAVFIGYQVLEVVEWQRRKRNFSGWKAWKFRISWYLSVALIVLAGASYLSSIGYFGPISSRVRGLFVKHTKTGNPLVDSVAEHQPASSEAYFQYLDVVCYIAPLGFALVAFKFFQDSSSFLLVYGLASYFFSHKMVRLILLMSPISSCLAGIVLGRAIGWSLYNILGFSPSILNDLFNNAIVESNKEVPKIKKNGKGKKNHPTEPETESHHKVNYLKFFLSKGLVLALVIFSLKLSAPYVNAYYEKADVLAKGMSHPTIVFKGQLQNGEEVLVDDYRDAYFWIKRNTPEDARVMAWWDYGYQITAMGNRTTIADGNTWNHEHIALLGRAFTSSEKEGHRIARHLADYILVWAGGGGDDLAKSPHLARIANSVYRHMCPGDPTCSRFGASRDGGGSKMMRESLVFHLVGNRMHEGVEVDPNRFREVYRTKFGKVRIYKIMSVSKESKQWVADPKNRKCDAPGSWFCPGQYPPGLKKILAEKRDFTQLEDFNKKRDDSEYQKQYFEHLNDKAKRDHIRMQSDNPTHKSEDNEKPKAKAWKPSREVHPEEIEKLNSHWENTATTTLMWEMISKGDVKDLLKYLTDSPDLAFVRSSDGRGPMWWAYESGNEKIVRILKKVGVREDLADANGLTPKTLAKKEK
mmetsp:Transcript_2292/g.3216  ORF Transcript_2292/g.3216 Transcript_2292/m.3216 type:complete len:979 (-) Transcript_2292:619-3555(-)